MLYDMDRKLIDIYLYIFIIYSMSQLLCFRWKHDSDRWYVSFLLVRIAVVLVVLFISVSLIVRVVISNPLSNNLQYLVLLEYLWLMNVLNTVCGCLWAILVVDSCWMYIFPISSPTLPASPLRERTWGTAVVLRLQDSMMRQPQPFREQSLVREDIFQKKSPSY